VNSLSYGSPAYTFYFLLLNAFPESLVLTLALFGLLNLRFKAGKILAIAGLQTISNLVEFLPVNPGVHSIILIFTLVIFIYIFTGARLSKIFLWVIICMIIITLSLMIYAQPLLGWTGLAYDTVNNSPFLASAFIVPYELLFLAFALWKNHYNRRRGLFLDT
jgi:hypothetical protein